VKNLLRLADLSQAEITTLLDLSERFANKGIPPARPGRFVCGLFFNPSLRTRTSLEVAALALGAHCIVHDVGQAVWKVETRDGVVMDGDAQEHVRDAVTHFLSGAVHLIGVRAFADVGRSYEENRADLVLRAIARAARVPVVSLESAWEHPMQGLADLLVLRRHRPRTVAITWAYHPRPLPMAVPNTALIGFARAGYDVRLVHPEGFELDPQVHEEAGGSVTVHHDMDEGLRGVDVIYAKSWGARGEYGLRANPEPRAALKGWIVDRERQADAAFMHCLPVRRNVVVTDEVIDGPRSWVAEQAHARVLTQAAVLHELLA
jgi:N-acetylornithine carbamoyltransferase